ncbi:1-acyl-sn-glycerol-3-phosphate acyltransferase [Gracilibacillus halotolerans]|uniref:1-acyl-sn-glycerol-3-phosphate acyltransferase n=1 Tax=Gracilibacillus halotolerans TaxID=74386 RepID=A0A841RS82_9BACI|nr:lysophospholipid acyltransferase family protein [Gracilibacillus halotolerans]MBB6513804.1 1-acyl-sn-glycerol-3-phosphate acyltransferase [Gracilibacillus halotolerans]
MYKFGRSVIHIFLSIFGGGVRAVNRNRIPSNLTGYVVVCTHRTWIDVLALGIAMKPTPLYYMAKKELFKSHVTKRFFTSLNAFPVDRENPGPSALKIPHKLLKEGKVVGIFPSGTRSSEETGLKKGAFVIAKRSGVPIIPAVYRGPTSLKGIFKREKIIVNFGHPVDLENYQMKDANYVLQTIQDRFHDLEMEIDK